MVLMLVSCYPFALYQSAAVLGPGDSQTGVGVGIISNAMDPNIDEEDRRDSFVSDFSVYFRAGIAPRTEMGVKFVGLPWRRGIILADAKYELIRKPLPLSLGLAISYWANSYQSLSYVGFHPAVVMGGDRLFSVLQYNYIAHPELVFKTLDVHLARRIELDDANSALTPMIGIHQGDQDPGSLYFSLGIGFQATLDIIPANYQP